MTYDYGTWDGNFHQLGNVAGEFHPGLNGTFVFHLPRTAIGSPPDGAHLAHTFSDTHASISALGSGVYFTADADRAPNANYGSDLVVGACPAKKK